MILFLLCSRGVTTSARVGQHHQFHLLNHHHHHHHHHSSLSSSVCSSYIRSRPSTAALASFLHRQYMMGATLQSILSNTYTTASSDYYSNDSQLTQLNWDNYLKNSYNYRNHTNDTNDTNSNDTRTDSSSSYDSIKISSFNLLAPCYKRMGVLDYRESNDHNKWSVRAKNTREFFHNELYREYDIIALQELWLDDEYISLFNHDFNTQGFDLFTLQRTGHKTDAVALAVRKEKFIIKGNENIHLCSQGDRVALLLWLYHIEMKRNILVTTTHLSFPHNVFDKMNQMRQMQTLTESIDKFISVNKIDSTSCVILGDFNVEARSPVCDHLRDSGYSSCFEVCPPAEVVAPLAANDRTATDATVVNSNSDTNISSSCNSGKGCSKAVKFVSHRTHRKEDLGVDHIFLKPECVRPPNTNASSGNSSSSDNFDCFKIYIKDTCVIPANLPSQIWNDVFDISDHRPVGTTLMIVK